MAKNNSLSKALIRRETKAGYAFMLPSLVFFIGFVIIPMVMCVVTSFFDSTLARCPRRTCEATFDRLMNCIWLDGSKGFKENMSFGDIENYICNLIEEEKNAKGKNKVLSNPYH